MDPHGWVQPIPADRVATSRWASIAVLFANLLVPLAIAALAVTVVAADPLTRAPVK